jgi:transposase
MMCPAFIASELSVFAGGDTQGHRGGDHVVFTLRRRAMKMQQVILKAMSGEYNWIQAAEILGMDVRSLLRWRRRMETHGYDGLLDRRRRVPSPRRIPVTEVERVLRLYREKYAGFNGRHFHQTACREHGVRLSYSFVKKALQEAGLLKKGRVRGRHRRRREPRACFGEMLHLDGSLHPWLALWPEQKQTLVAVQDDATKRLLHAELFESESTFAVMTALRQVLVSQGLPMALYSDRASWAVYTPKAGGAYDRDRLTQVGRALKRLGIEHILSYSPQARGRSERLNRTLQDRLVNELRVAGIRRVPAANRYIRERFLPRHNEQFARAPQDPDPGLRTARPGRSRAVSLSRRGARGRPGQHRDPGPGPPANRQATGAADLCGPAGCHPPTSRRPALHLVGHPLSGPLRPPWTTREAQACGRCRSCGR